MEKKKTKAASVTRTNHAKPGSPVGPALPDGFEEIAGARVAGWFARIGSTGEGEGFELSEDSPTDERTPNGNQLRGILREVFEVKSRFRKEDGSTKKRVFKIETTVAGTLIEVPTDVKGETELEECGAGVLVGLDESGWLKRLSDVEVGREVYIRCLGLSVPTDDAPQGAWRYVVAQSKRAPRGTRVNGVTGEVTGA